MTSNGNNGGGELKMNGLPSTAILLELVNHVGLRMSITDRVSFGQTESAEGAKECAGRSMDSHGNRNVSKLGYLLWNVPSFIVRLEGAVIVP
eukprot:scaffold22577_cov122-Cylindrotheca_fusiformis.AAC.14